jgi:hypothetical protein
MTKIATRAKQYDLYIDGRWTAGTGTEVISVVNPATEEEIGSADGFRRRYGALHRGRPAGLR